LLEIKINKQETAASDVTMVIKTLTASVAEWVRAWDSFLMVKECGRLGVQSPAVALY
jgi:hypothetical protein